ncbi:MAG: phosphate ABC transporter, permease protein PstA [Nitrospiraceae bacterium]|nr:phosphate ABC transporter, permease protein PstA [Nitrospiraceae bacterium]|tara:strand:- start:244 stop:1095 length:852 start_codon:yes stop_codon:yes gene_type:complete
MMSVRGRSLAGVCWLFLTGITTVISVMLLVSVVTVMVAKGGAVLTWEFLSQPSRAFGAEGGIRSQIMGTLILALGAGLVSLPIALGTALYQSEYLALRFQSIVMRFIYALNGVPTILFGLFGYLVFGLYLGLGISWLSGVLILAMMILPTLVVSIREAIESIPSQYREAGLALGMTSPQLIRAVIVPHSFHGTVTGLLLGLARAAGETAAILFTATAFSGVDMPRSFNEPVTTLQTHILVLSQEAVNSSATSAVWGAALMLMVLVFCFSLGAFAIRSRFRIEV